MEIKENVSLAPYTTFKVGGPAEFFVVVKSEEDLSASLSEARERSLPVTIIGGGSNVLISDEGLKGMVIKNEIKGVAYEEIGGDILVTAGGGMWWDDLVEETVSKDLWGMENLSSIPGTVGATPVQNVGAYGVEVSELIRSVRVCDIVSGSFKVMSPNDCRFGYRDSIFKTEEGKRFVVVGVTYALSRVSMPRLEYKDLAERFSKAGVGAQERSPFAPTPADIRAAVIDIRKKKFPDLKVVGTAGSFFKNPIVSKDEAAALHLLYPELPTYPQSDGRVKVSLGFVLDKICGLRGWRDGGVGLYENQALVLVNYENASAKNISDFAEKVAEKVFSKTKIKIEPEVNFLF